jgi:hypothetical protein
LDLDPSNPAFQQATRAKLPGFPVAFDAVRNAQGYSATGTVIPYERLETNAGDSMNVAGTFTVPMRGVYYFAFCFTESGTGVRNVVWLRVNRWANKGSVESQDHGNGDVIPSCVHMTVALNRGDVVDAYLQSGSLLGAEMLNGNSPTHFIGFLLYPF